MVDCMLSKNCISGDGEADDFAWEVVAVLGPTKAVMQNLGGAFMEEEGSASIQNIDIVPLVVEGREIPGVTVVVARLGGYVKLVPLYWCHCLLRSGTDQK
jgi:hypothetical protein